jgi:raffinose/stachyose/melibiose transport system permease protein
LKRQRLTDESLPRRLSKIAWLFCSNLFLIVMLLLSMYPLIWMGLTSLRTNFELYENPWGLPSALIFENYVKVWQTSPIPTFFLNSIIVTSSSVIIIIMFSSMAAYAFSKLRFRGSNLLFYGFLSLYFVPPHIALVPLLFTLKALHLTNTYFALILPYVAFSLPFTTLLIRSFMISLPSALTDAALIDGCSKFGIFFRIILPLSRPVLALATVIQCVFLWNEYLLALVFVNKRNLMTLPVGLMDFVGEFHTDWVAMAAGLSIATIPIIILYIIFRKQILTGMTAGALKG